MRQSIKRAAATPGTPVGGASRYAEAVTLERFMIAGAVVLVVLPFTCVRKPPGDKPVVRLWASSHLAEKPLFLKAVEAFKRRHPGIDVKYEDPGGRTEKYLAAVQAGSCGDVLLVHWREMPTLSAKGALEPLDPFIERDGYDLGDFFPGSVDAYSYKGGTYGLPHKGSTMLLFYNKKLFDEAGVDYPTNEWTRDDFLEAAKRLTKYDKFGLPTQVGCLPYSPYSWAWSAGGEFSDDEMTETSFSDPRTLSGLEFYAGLRNRWKVSTRSMSVGGRDPANVDVFEAGTIAMAVTGPWMLPTYMPIRDFEWDIALFPKGPAGRRTRYAGMGFAMWSGSPRKDEAWRLLSFLTGPESGAIFSEGFMDIPARRSVAHGVFARQEAPFTMKMMLDSMEPEHGRIRVFPRNEKWPDVDRYFKEEFEAALFGDKTVKEALHAVDRRARRYLAEERARKDVRAGVADYVAIVTLVAFAFAGAAFLRFRSIRLAGTGSQQG